MLFAGCIAIGSCLVHLCASGAVIGVPSQNGRGPIKLFQKHDANHLVRPGRGAERQSQFCHAPQFGRKSVRPADYENTVGDLVVSPTAKMPGKGLAVDIVTPLVERDQDGFFRNRGRNRVGLFGDARTGIARPALGNFENFEATKSKPAANVVEALPVALRQFPLRTLLEPSNGDDDQSHGDIFPAKRLSGLELRSHTLDQSVRRNRLPKRQIDHAAHIQPVTRSADGIAAGQIVFAAIGPWVHNLSRL
jgi:hypothetical protein